MKQSRRYCVLKLLSLLAIAMSVVVAESGVTEAQKTQMFSGIYKICARHSGKCIDVHGQWENDGANVHQWTWWEGRNQMWSIEPAQNGQHLIRAVHSKKCLDVYGGWMGNYANIHQWTCHGAENQRWTFEHVEGQWYRIRAARSGKYVDVESGGYQDGANIHQWEWQDDFLQGYNQQWQLIPVVDVCSTGYIDMADVYPWPMDKVFTYREYDSYGNPKGSQQMLFEPWGDQKTYTLHHWWGNWCPDRIDDVFRWEFGLNGATNERLFYFDTFNFDNSQHVKIRNPGHVWAVRCMQLNGPFTSVDNTTKVWNFDTNPPGCPQGCCVGQDLGPPIGVSNNRVKKQIRDGYTTWSPYSDWFCSQQYCYGAYYSRGHWWVPVLRLEEKTLLSKNENNYWREMWFLWYQPLWGRYVALASKGFRYCHLPGSEGEPCYSSPDLLWLVRLDYVTNR